MSQDPKHAIRTLIHPLPCGISEQPNEMLKTPFARGSRYLPSTMSKGELAALDRCPRRLSLSPSNRLIASLESPSTPTLATPDGQKVAVEAQGQFYPLNSLKTSLSCVSIPRSHSFVDFIPFPSRCPTSVACLPEDDSPTLAAYPPSEPLIFASIASFAEQVIFMEPHDPRTTVSSSYSMTTNTKPPPAVPFNRSPTYHLPPLAVYRHHLPPCDPYPVFSPATLSCPQAPTFSFIPPIPDQNRQTLSDARLASDRRDEQETRRLSVNVLDLGVSPLRRSQSDVFRDATRPRSRYAFGETEPFTAMSPGVILGGQAFLHYAEFQSHSTVVRVPGVPSTGSACQDTSFPKAIPRGQGITSKQDSNRRSLSAISRSFGQDLPNSPDPNSTRLQAHRSERNGKGKQRRDRRQITRLPLVNKQSRSYSQPIYHTAKMMHTSPRQWTSRSTISIPPYLGMGFEVAAASSAFRTEAGTYVHVPLRLSGWHDHPSRR